MNDQQSEKDTIILLNKINTGFLFIMIGSFILEWSIMSILSLAVIVIVTAIIALSIV